MVIPVLLYSLFLGTLLRPVCTGLWNYRRVFPAYRPMLLFLLGVLLLSLVQNFISSRYRIVQVSAGLEPLLEIALITWQAKRWQIFDRRPALFWLILALSFVGWLAGQLFVPAYPGNISWFSVSASFGITLIAIETLNRTMIGSSAPLFRNPVFLFSIALIFQFTFSGLLDVFMLIGQFYGEPLLEKVYYFQVALGLFTNYLYLRSVLCLPTRTNYSVS